MHVVLVVVGLVEEELSSNKTVKLRSDIIYSQQWQLEIPAHKLRNPPVIVTNSHAPHCSNQKQTETKARTKKIQEQ